MSVTGSLSARLLIGILLAPITTGLVFLCVSAFGNLSEGVWALKLSALVGYTAAIVLGLPAHLLLRKLGWTNLLSYLVIGLLIGLVVGAALFSPVFVGNIGLTPSSGKSLAPSAAIFVLAAFFGALSSLVFWIIARPDRI